MPCSIDGYHRPSFRASRVVALVGLVLCAAAVSAGTAPVGEPPFRPFGSIVDPAGLSLASDGAEGDRLGSALAVDADWLVTGAPGDAVAGATGRGSAHVWRREGAGWTVVQKLIAPDGAAGDGFGTAVAIAGDTVVVGAPAARAGRAGPAGAAYIFRRAGTQWQHAATVVGDEVSSFADFGAVVAVSGTAVVVGAPGEFESAADAGGAVYLHRGDGSTWTREARLRIAGSRAFGRTLDVDGDQLLVGAPDSSVAGQSFQGAAFVFRHAAGQWTLQRRLQGSLDLAGDAFGSRVALEGDRALVSALPFASSLNWPGRTVYVFDRTASDWQETAQLFVDKQVNNSNFGAVLDLRGGIVAVGDPPRGNVYVFRPSPSGWSPPERIEGTALGRALDGPLAIDGARLLLGAPFDTVDGNPEQGAVVPLDRTTASWQLGPRLVLGTASRLNLQAANRISIDGEWMAVGIPLGDSVLMYRFDGSAWRFTARITRGGLGPNIASFGGAVALSGDDLFVSARSAGGGGLQATGRVFRYRRVGDAWTDAGDLQVQGGITPTFFGCDLSIDDDTLLVGSCLSTVGDAIFAGAAFVFVRTGDTWLQQATLVSDQPVRSAALGEFVDVDGDWAVLGGIRWFPGGNVTLEPSRGIVHLYERAGGNWTLIRTWTGADTPFPYESLGSAVAVDATRRIVALGAPGRAVVDGGGTRFGGLDLHRFDGTAWTLERVDGSRAAVQGQVAGAVVGQTLALRDGWLAAGFGRTSGTGGIEDDWPSAQVFDVTGPGAVRRQIVPMIGSIGERAIGLAMTFGPDGQWVIPRPDAAGPAPFGGANAGAIEVWDRNRLFSDEFE